MAVYLGSNKVNAFGGQPQGGGPSNIITGTFKDESGESGPMSITLPYTGNGYPIAVLVDVAHGFTDPNYKDVIHRYGMLHYLMEKMDKDIAPTYPDVETSASSDIENKGCVIYEMKSSTTNAATISRNGLYFTANNALYNKSAAKNTNGRSVYVNSSTQLSVYISGESDTRGFMTGVEYRYVVVYSE